MIANNRFGITLGVVGVFCLVSIAGIGVFPVAADSHTKETAVDFTDQSNFTVAFPDATVHNPDNREGQIEYHVSSPHLFAELDAEQGIHIDRFIVDAGWIDYSQCDGRLVDTGIDRGNSLSGSQVDSEHEALDIDYREDRYHVTFYDFDDFGGDPPYLSSQHQFIFVDPLEQELNSESGCPTITDEPGWYQMEAFMNGTVADNGPDEAPSENADQVGFTLKSNYVYICECESRAEAEEELGPPPREVPQTTPTEPEEGMATTATASGTPDIEAGTGTTDTSVSTDSSRGGSTDADTDANTDADDVRTGTTEGDAPGFGPITVLLTLLISTLLLRWRF
jgi:hypothetical protein